MSNVNRFNRAMSDAWFNAEKGKTKAILRAETEDATARLRDLNRMIAMQQGEVVEERGEWNTVGSVAGCIGGGILGFVFGGPVGALAGCATGGKVGSTVSDWAYDSSWFDTAAEEELQQLEQDLANYDINISDEAQKFGFADLASDFETDTIGRRDQMMAQYDTFIEDFYGTTGGDYLLQLAVIGVEFAATKIGGDILKSVFSSAEAVDAADDVASLSLDVAEQTSAYSSGSLVSTEDLVQNYFATAPWQEAELTTEILQAGEAAADILPSSVLSTTDIVSNLDANAMSDLFNAPTMSSIFTEPFEWPTGSVPSAMPFGDTASMSTMMSENYEDLKALFDYDNMFDYSDELFNPELDPVYLFPENYLGEGVYK